MKAHGIDLDSDAMRDFCRKWKLKELSVFGSFVREDFGPDSDIDFLADYDDDAEWDLFDDMRMQEELEEILGRPVDIIDRYTIEHDGNRFLKKEIHSTVVPVYAR